MNHTNAAYCLIGLSLANEGILGGGKDKVYRQYGTNMRKLVDMMAADGIDAVVGGIYANGLYTALEYDYARRMTIETSKWEVPNVNFMGAIDNLAGKWAPGFENDAFHPNNAGHSEMYYSIVPTLFEALKQKKPKRSRLDGRQFIPVERFLGDGDRYPFRYTIPGTTTTTPAALRKRDVQTMHSFSLQFGMRTEASNGVVHVIETESGSVVVRLNEKGELTYNTPRGSNVVMGNRAINDGQWHDITVAHYWAMKRTLLFVDGNVSSVVEIAGERYTPLEFVLGGPASTGGVSPLGVVDFQDWMVWRSALNAGEVAYMHAERALFHSSLEMYAPLSITDPYLNMAQSTTEFLFFDTLQAQFTDHNMELPVCFSPCLQRNTGASFFNTDGVVDVCAFAEWWQAAETRLCSRFCTELELTALGSLLNGCDEEVDLKSLRFGVWVCRGTFVYTGIVHVMTTSPSPHFPGKAYVIDEFQTVSNLPSDISNLASVVSISFVCPLAILNGWTPEVPARPRARPSPDCIKRFSYDVN
jgi:hypothetical protein